jgi:hypothetical protein
MPIKEELNHLGFKPRNIKMKLRVSGSELLINQHKLQIEGRNLYYFKMLKLRIIGQCHSKRVNLSQEQPLRPSL